MNQEKINEKVIEYIDKSSTVIEDISLYVKKDTPEEWAEYSQHVIGFLKWLHHRNQINILSEQEDVRIIFEKAKNDDTYYFKLLEDFFDFQLSLDMIDSEIRLFVGLRYQDYLQKVDTDDSYEKMIAILDNLLAEYESNSDKYITKYYQENKDNINLVSKTGSNWWVNFFGVVVIIVLYIVYNSYQDIIIDWLQKITS